MWPRDTSNRGFHAGRKDAIEWRRSRWRWIKFGFVDCLRTANIHRRAQRLGWLCYGEGVRVGGGTGRGWYWSHQWAVELRLSGLVDVLSFQLNPYSGWFPGGNGGNGIIMLKSHNPSDPDVAR